MIEEFKDSLNGEGMMRFGEGVGVMGGYILKCLLSLRWNFCKYVDLFIYLLDMCCS
jgi:hypothetical protein